MSDVVAERIKEVRKGKGLNVDKLAERCAAVGATRITASVLMNIESGRRDKDGRRRRDVSADELLAVARALGVSPLVLLLPSKDEPYAVTPTETALAHYVYEWILGERLPPLPSTDDEADEWTDEDRAAAWHLFANELKYGRQLHLAERARLMGLRAQRRIAEAVLLSRLGEDTIHINVSDIMREMARLEGERVARLQEEGARDAESDDQTG